MSSRSASRARGSRLTPETSWVVVRLLMVETRRGKKTRSEEEKEEGEKVVGSSTEEEIFGHGIRFVARDELYPAIDKDVAAGRGGIAMI